MKNKFMVRAINKFCVRRSMEVQGIKLIFKIKDFQILRTFTNVFIYLDPSKNTNRVQIQNF
jgi:hypothetical protein